MVDSGILLSGGIESAVLAARLKNAGDNVTSIALHYNLGRPSADYELHFARRTAATYNLQFEEVDLSKFWRPLLGFFDPEQIILEFDSIIEPDRAIGKKNVANGFPVTLSAALFYAASVGIKEVHAGLTSDQHKGGKENDSDDVYAGWNSAMNELLGSSSKVQLIFPFKKLTKAQVVTEGASIGVDFTKTWSCFIGPDKHCGRCRGCKSRKAAFKKAGVDDPTDYA